MSSLLLDADSLANVLGRLNIEKVRIDGSNLAFSVRDADVQVEVQQLSFAGNVRVNGLRIAVTGVNVDKDGVQLEFRVV